MRRYRSTPAKQFCRIEQKFLVHRLQAEEILDAVRHRLIPDPLADPDGRYSVTSLYLDTPKFDIYRSKLNPELPRHRFKIRLRVYGTEFDADSHALVELKSKDDDGYVRKNRVELPFELAYGLCSGWLPPELADPRETALALRVEFLVRQMRLKPSSVVSYLRCAFLEPNGEQDFRLTIDSDLDCKEPIPGHGPSPVQRFLPDDYRILELKFADRLPNWIKPVLARTGAVTRPYSKYVASMVALEDHRMRMRTAL